MMNLGEVNGENIKSPVLLVCLFERVGSTWLMDWFDKIGRGYTEVFRQHLGRGHPFCSFDRSVDKIERPFYHEDLRDNVFGQYWLRNFEGWQEFPELAFFKETNLFLAWGGFLSFFSKNVPVILLTRDLRGIISSFKKGGLYEKWNYKGRYCEIKQLILNIQSNYKWIVETTHEDDWLDVLITLFLINVLEIQKLVLGERGENLLILPYEEMIIAEEEAKRKIKEFIGFKGEIAERRTVVESVSEFNIYKEKKDMKDWLEVLDVREIRFIEEKLEERMIEVENEFGREVVNDLVRLGLRLKRIDETEIRVGISRKNFANKSAVNPAELELDQIKGKLDLRLIKGGSFVMGRQADRRCLVDRAVEISDFSVASMTVTNLEFASMLNWLNRKGFKNERRGNYLFINSFMPPNRGGRIFTTDGGYGVLSGYEEHPVNWVSWLGAVFFARWLGCRLLLEEEWEYIAQQVDFSGEENIQFKLGDTCRVDEGNDNNLGLWQWWGNVKTWCNNWYYPGYEVKNNICLMKSVRGGAWNSEKPEVYERNYKPYLIGARSTGIRLAGANNELAMESIEKFKFVLNDRKLLELSVFEANQRVVGCLI